MKLHRSSVFLFVGLLAACVDRIDFNTHLDYYPVVVEGYISDQPGPYEVRITRSFDVQSKGATKKEISAKKVELFDDEGNSEQLNEIKLGTYQTNPNGMQGIAGHAYKLRVELLDGTIYESIPDTLLSTGVVDSVYFSFVSQGLPDFTTYYGFDIFFNAQLSEKKVENAMWKFVGTYQIDTNPEQRTVACGESRCPDPPPCSGWTKGGEQIGPCECCTCWVDFQNDLPIVSDNLVVEGGHYNNVKAFRLPLDGWVFQHKMYAQVQQMGLTKRAFAFWKAVKAQKEASGSLFQPISGIVPTNFVQVGGTPSQIEGIFYATAIKSKGVFITRDDIPKTSYIQSVLPYPESCLMFPHSTTIKPYFWE